MSPLLSPDSREPALHLPDLLLGAQESNCRSGHNPVMQPVKDFAGERVSWVELSPKQVRTFLSGRCESGMVRSGSAGTSFLRMVCFWLTSFAAFILCGFLAWLGSRRLVPHLHEKWHAKIESATEDSRLLSAELKEKGGHHVTPWLRSLVGGYEPLMYYAAFLMAGVGVLAFFIGWVGFKTLFGWKGREPETYYLQGAMVTLPLNVLNLSFGVAAGFLFKALQALVLPSICS